MIIGIYGKIKSGKDTAARIIQYLTQKDNKLSLEEILSYKPFQQPPTSEWIIKKFAGKLKQCISIISGISLEELENHKIKEQNMPPEWNKKIYNSNRTNYIEIPMTYRDMLQQLGTQVCRVIHPDFWINALFCDYKPTIIAETKNAENIFQFPKWIISDVRFPNEVEAIEKRGGFVIKITRNNNEIDQDYTNVNQIQHESETALDNYQFKYIINNNYDITTLVENIRDILKKENII